MTSQPNRLPPFAISQVSTLASSFGDDVRAYAAAGVDGIGIWELKLAEGSDAQALEELDASGLGRAAPVLDPFLGLGSTAVACAALGLDFIGIDLDQGYVDEAVDRVRRLGRGQLEPRIENAE